MAGPSLGFVGFAMLVALLVGAVRSLSGRQWIMLVASGLFLASFSKDLLAFLPLVGFLVVGFGALRLVEKWGNQGFTAVLVGVLALFVWIKKYAFVPSVLTLPFPYVTIGLSYILFRLLHLIIEARGDASYLGIPFRLYLGYLIGFNTLVAGPIQRFDEFRDQEAFATDNRISLGDIGEALARIVAGLWKTNVLAALLSYYRLEALARLSGPLSPLDQLLNGAATFALYALFLYCNFSGYIDIVLGVSRLLGVRLPENFDRPFSATSFIDFWNRWHITLSRWLRTYIYNPLLISLLRRFPSPNLESAWATLAFFVTFFLVGAWHGQTTAFLFFGFLQGLGVAVNKLYQITLMKRLGRKNFEKLSSLSLYAVLARGLTFTWFTFTLTWFWASWDEATKVWSSLHVSQWMLVWLGILATSSIALWLWERARRAALSVQWRQRPLLYSRRVRTAWYTALLVVVVAAAVLSNQSAPEIVYKDF